MSLFEFLGTLENTLNEIEVKGKKNINYLGGCFRAIDELRKALNEQSPVTDNKQQSGGEEDGRQTDTGLTACDNDK